VQDGHIPAACHSAVWRQVSSSTQSPSASTTPVRSATGMKPAGGIRPRSGSRQRTSDSTPMITLSLARQTGW
jgi:hypothetical protein